jgi:Tfp pilus assembly protein PilN
MAPARTTSVNLLNQDEFSSSATGKFLLWALSIGRYIVVFTELIVILSFLSRFKLDKDLTDLNEDIAVQKQVILAYNDLESNFRHVQSQLALVKSVRSDAKAYEMLDTLSRIQPSDIKLSALDISTDSLSLGGIALSPQSLSIFVRRLEKDPRVNNISLDKISSEDEGLTIEFNIAAKISNEVE